MTYDTYGNIVSKNGKTYSYDSTWKDLLLSVDGEPIVYDAQGNPTKYLGHDLTWEKGRQLKSFDNIQYTYNANGIRTSKTIGGVKHEYMLDGTKILRETWGDNTLIPLYDNEDSVCGIIYNKFPYYFLKNLQGDVIAITNSKGDVVAQYTYDAWGECTIVSDTTGIIARINPYRYRGYYFDQEIGLYYLQSRYSDPSIGRFINFDNTDMISPSRCVLDSNLFAYCTNNPISNSDYSGEISPAIAGALVNGIIEFLLYYLECYLGMRHWNWFTMVTIVGINAAKGAFLWYLGLGGKFQKVLKLLGKVQKLKKSDTVIKGISLFAKGFSFLVNMVLKGGSRKIGESWFSAIRRLLKKGIGVSI